MIFSHENITMSLVFVMFQLKRIVNRYIQVIRVDMF